ncbi:MAG: protein kinase [Ktedonobacteraceae bacterium]|nr:protein kinase [Ktedonobacteraceae bacterium]
MSDHIGLKLGNYRILRLIGRGGFANVYQGEHIYLKIPAAIKVLNIQLTDDALESFLNEARIIALLEHPRIVRVLEFGVEQGTTPFLVMNYAENGTLRQRYPGKSILPWGSILSYTKQVAEALQYAHEHGVIHRDVKPENMLLGKNQRIQLSDFGLALLAQATHTHRSGSAGTTAYMAPEQLQGHPCPASDQYALGVVVYEWICGSWPFTGSEREITIQQLYASPPSICTKVPGVSSALERVIMQALAKDPQARFASVQEFAQALEQAVISEARIDTGENSTPSPELIENSSSYEQADTDSSPEAAYNQTQQQESLDMPSPSNFLPQLPLLVYESPLTNSGRILQPSLGPSIYSPGYSLGELSLPAAISLEDDAPQSSQAPLSSPTPTLEPLPDLSTPASLPVIQREEEQATSLPQIQAQNGVTRNFRLSRRTTFAALAGMAIIGLVILAGMFIETRAANTVQKASLNQSSGSSPVVPANSTTSATTPHGAGSPPDTHHSTGNAPSTSTQPGISPGSAPVPTSGPVLTPGIQPTPIPPAGTTPTPAPPGITPTPVVPLTVDIVNCPKTAMAGSTITVVTQASRGGVTIDLDGKVRDFGQQVADSQGLATFQIFVPLRARRMVLTAIAIDTNGDQVQSLPQPVIVTPNGNGHLQPSSMVPA